MCFCAYPPTASLNSYRFQFVHPLLLSTDPHPSQWAVAICYYIILCHTDCDSNYSPCLGDLGVRDGLFAGVIIRWLFWCNVFISSKKLHWREMKTPQTRDKWYYLPSVGQGKQVHLNYLWWNVWNASLVMIGVSFAQAASHTVSLAATRCCVHLHHVSFKSSVIFR